MDAAPATASRSARALAVGVAALLGGILLVTSTLRLSDTIWPYDVKRLLQLLALVVILTATLLHRELRSAWCGQLGAVPRWIKACLAAIFALGVLSAVVNAQSLLHGLNSLSEVAMMVMLVATVLVIAALRRLGGKLFDQVALGLLALTAVAVGIQEVMGVLAARLAGLPVRFEVALQFFSYPRFYNQVQSWLIPALTALPLLFSSHRLVRALAWLALSLSWFVVFLTAPRGTAVGVLGAFTLGLLLLPAIRKRLLIGQGLGFLAGLALFAFLVFSPLAGESNPVSDEAGISDLGTEYQERIGRKSTTSSGRLVWMWPNAIDDIQAHPVIGKGPMNYACTEFRGFGHPHNFLLQAAAEWGLPAALLAFVVVAGLLIIGFVRCRAGRDMAAPFLLLGVVAASIHALFSGVMVMPASQVTGLLIGGMLIGRLSGPGEQTGRRLSLIALFIAAELALAVLLLGLFEIRTMAVRSEQLAPGESLHPRMWQDSRVCSLYVPNQPVTQ